ncbi:hypothetical protein [Acetobacterium woodii]|uniref:hypothetical protein n=1 Tax=Acetobacterium woodii TaxID=33952 RepID=UPI0011AEB8C1|nr:hypothetical protein [Acetobacterium woodii]
MDNKKLEDETERRYGFGRLEKELQKKAAAEEKKGSELKNRDEQKVKKKKTKVVKEIAMEGTLKNCEQSQTEPLSNVEDGKIDKKITISNENDQNR